jgi:hypothetical protein
MAPGENMALSSQAQFALAFDLMAFAVRFPKLLLSYFLFICIFPFAGSPCFPVPLVPDWLTLCQLQHRAFNEMSIPATHGIQPTVAQII